MTTTSTCEGAEHSGVRELAPAFLELSWTSGAPELVWEPPEEREAGSEGRRGCGGRPAGGAGGEGRQVMRRRRLLQAPPPTWPPPAARALSPNSMAVMQMSSSRTRKITRVPKMPSISSCGGSRG